MQPDKHVQVFFEGSWSQVCATTFGAADADVACRQLGYGAGTTLPADLVQAELHDQTSANIFPEVAIVGSACTGVEERLVDCSTNTGIDGTLTGSEPEYSLSEDCQNSNSNGLVLACVVAPFTGEEAGVEIHPH